MSCSLVCLGGAVFMLTSKIQKLSGEMGDTGPGTTYKLANPIKGRKVYRALLSTEPKKINIPESFNLKNLLLQPTEEITFP